MLPIANTNVANWKLGIGIGNNGNISPRFVQPAKQAFSCTASGGFRVRRAVVPEGWRTSGARRTACRPSRCAATDANRRKAIDRDGGFRGRAQAPVVDLFSTGFTSALRLSRPHSTASQDAPSSRRIHLGTGTGYPIFHISYLRLHESASFPTAFEATAPPPVQGVRAPFSPQARTSQQSPSTAG